MTIPTKLPDAEVKGRKMNYLCIPLRGKKYPGVALVSECAWLLVDGQHWYGTANGYVASRKGELMHRRLMAAESGEHIDHLNFNRVDNRYQNLVCGTQQANNLRARKRKNTPWPYKGVRLQYGRWYARIVGKHIGVFDTAEDAARAYDDAARRLCGRDAVCNFGER